MFTINTRRCVNATALAAATTLALAAGDVLGRQPESATLAPLQPAADAPVAKVPMDPAAAMRVYAALSANVREWAVGEAVQLPAEASSVGAACVELRHEGNVIGRAAAEGAGALAHAHDAAMQAADHRLPVPADALRPQNAKLAAERIMLSVELAGTLVPFDAKTLVQLDTLLSPGLDGVAVRIGERVGLVFPAEMLADSMTPSSALGLAASRTGDAALSVLDPATLRKDHGAVLYRFRVIHLAQTAPGAAPVFLFRGGKPVAATSITTPAVHELADGIAAHLVREVFGQAGVTGPIAVSPPVEDHVAVWEPFTKAIVARALGEYAADAPEGAPRLAARYASRALCEILARQMPRNPSEAAAYINAKAAFLRAAREPIGEQSLRGDFLFANPAFRFNAAEIAARGDAGWIALAAAECGATSAQHADGAAAIIDAILSAPTRETAIPHLPFVVEAELRLATSRTAFAPGVARVLPHRKAMVEIREKLTSVMADDTSAPDFDGGFVFAGSPYPTWHSARPAAFLAMVLGEPLVTPQVQAVPELLRTLRAVRFLRQLCVDNTNGWMQSDEDAQRWGVRLSAWDKKTSPDASAITLLTAIHTLRSIQSMEAGTRDSTPEK